MAAPRLSPGYVHATSPVHSEPVVFAPGQELPGWMREALDGGAVLVPDEADGSFTLQRGQRRAESRRSTAGPGT